MTVFVIQELPAQGSKENRDAIRFEWDRRHRNIPRQPWTFPKTVTTSRTDYPGTVNDPTEQVLNVHFDPFTLEGRWSDKFNGPGYAIRTLRKFEDLVDAANLVQFTFGSIFFVGLITNLTPTYLRDQEIRYAFTVSPHHRQPGKRAGRSPRTVLNAAQLQTESQNVLDAAEAAHARAPLFFVTGSLYADVTAELAVWTATLSSIDDTINQRVVLPDFEPSSALRRLAALFRLLKATGETLRTLVRNVRSDTDLGFISGASTLNFDAWVHAIAAESRRMMIHGERSGRELESRADPVAIALYRPHAGEHLMKISNRFYNTPFNWRRIATRNKLGNTTTLTGEELLIIPEATAR